MKGPGKGGTHVSRHLLFPVEALNTSNQHVCGSVGSWLLFSSKQIYVPQALAVDSALAAEC